MNATTRMLSSGPLDRPLTQATQALWAPPELGEARRWYEKAAAAGDTDAMRSLGFLFANRLSPPELGEARRWYEKAAAGDIDALLSLVDLGRRCK